MSLLPGLVFRANTPSFAHAYFGTHGNFGFGKKHSHPSLSSVCNHSTETCHSLSFDNFSDLSSSNSTFELLMQESLLIFKSNLLLMKTVPFRFLCFDVSAFSPSSHWLINYRLCRYISIGFLFAICHFDDVARLQRDISVINLYKELDVRFSWNFGNSSTSFVPSRESWARCLKFPIFPGRIAAR